MLDQRFQELGFSALWDSLDCAVRLPAEIQESFFAQEGMTPTHFDERRRFPRFYFRDKAIIERDGQQFGVYTADLSRVGILLLHSQQLLPCEAIRLLLPSGKVMDLTVRRCRRQGKLCYECGCQIVSQTMGSSDH